MDKRLVWRKRANERWATGVLLPGGIRKFLQQVACNKPYRLLPFQETILRQRRRGVR